MKLSAVEIRKWVQRISDEYMHYSKEDIDYAVAMGQFMDVWLLPNDEGIIAYSIMKDFDCKKKLVVILFYCKPECRGRHLFTMFHKLEEIAKQEGISKIVIGDSDSGYKEEKFNRMLEYFGYRHSGHCKEIR